MNRILNTLWSCKTGPERVNWVSMCVWGKNKVPHPLLQSPHPVLLRRRLCSLPLLSPVRRAKLRGQSVCKFPSSFPLSLTLSVFPHPRVYRALVLSLWLLAQCARDIWLLQKLRDRIKVTKCYVLICVSYNNAHWHSIRIHTIWHPYIL